MRLSLSKHLAHNLGNLLLLGKIGVFHNRRNASSRLLLLISKHLILCIYLVFRDRKSGSAGMPRSEERFSRNAETDLVCRLLLEKKKNNTNSTHRTFLARTHFPTPPAGVLLSWLLRSRTVPPQATARCAPELSHP